MNTKSRFNFKYLFVLYLVLIILIVPVGCAVNEMPYFLEPDFYNLETENDSIGFAQITIRNLIKEDKVSNKPVDTPINPHKGIVEASGLYYRKGKIYVVSDAVDYYYVENKSISKILLNSNFELKRSTNTSPIRIRKKHLKQKLKNIDIEGMTIIKGSSPLFIAESLGVLFDEKKLYANYYKKGLVDYSWNRGIEGISAIQIENTKNFEVAVIWEGGYPQNCDEVKSVKTAANPVIIIHNIENKGKDGYEANDKPIQFKLKMDNINSLIDSKEKLDSKDKIKRSRFRAPELLHYNENFLVLLSSMNYNDNCEEEYKYKYLQVFDRQGNPVSEPYDLRNDFTNAKANINWNWEGMTWVNENSSLLFINDSTNLSPTLVHISLPKFKKLSK